MSERAKPPAKDHKAARNARLEAALRENLKRRKAQARARSQETADASHDSAGIPAEEGIAFSGEVDTGSPQKTRQR